MRAAKLRLRRMIDSCRVLSDVVIDLELPESDQTGFQKMEPLLSPTGRKFLNRRRFLQSASAGIGGVALASLLQGEKLLAADAPRMPIRPVIRPEAPLASRPPHFSPKANRVLVIFCSGAVSHVDTFDYKPELIKRNGQPMPGAASLITFQGQQGNLVQSPWAFKPRGRCGKFTSDLLPRLGELADEMCFIHSMTARSNTHGPGETQMGTGFTLEGFPSMGAWVSYALGSESEEMPAFVAIPDPRGVPQTGPSQWGSGFLPPVFQGTPFGADRAIPNLATPAGISRQSDGASRDFLKFLNDEHLKQHPEDEELSARIASYELAAKMQIRAFEIGNLASEPDFIREMYGVNDANKVKAGFAQLPVGAPATGARRPVR